MRVPSRVSIFVFILFISVGVIVLLFNSTMDDDNVFEDAPTVASKQRDVQYALAYQDEQTVAASDFLQLLRSQGPVEIQLKKIEKNWDISFVPMLLEVANFQSRPARSRVISLLEFKTGKKFGTDFDKWYQWIWKQDFKEHPEYAKFKLSLYSRIDPRFSEYFVDTHDAKIRLDEIRWGGVRRDGIPPLKNPKMLSVSQSNYLADSDVVFGIEVNGDARAYPKRILAWHEMFKDTIGGESVCGVY